MADQLAQVYDQLRAVARQRMTLERAAGNGHTLQATAVVNEAYARLAREGAVDWPGSREFFISAAREIERVLIDHARAKYAQKRGGDPGKGGHARIPIDVVDLAARDPDEAPLALREAILRLEQEDPQAGAVVRLRFFAGLSAYETALTLGISERTVVRDWVYARAFLADALEQDREGG